MIRGTFDIRKASNPGGDIDVYQVHFEELSGGTYDASMSLAAVEELLYDTLHLNMEIDDLHARVDELKRTGRMRIDDVETEEAELGDAGLVYLPYAG
jgi:hypothetical protein